MIKRLFVFYLIHQIFQAIQPYFAPIGFVFAWGFILLLGWGLAGTIVATLATAKQMHQIPCPNCRFFTDNHRLKCTVKPFMANTEEAIGCSDYCPRQSYYS